MTIHQIADFLNKKGLKCEIITAFDNILRIGYWKRMPAEYAAKFKHFIEEEELYDSDCGYQYSYKLKD